MSWAACAGDVHVEGPRLRPAEEGRLLLECLPSEGMEGSQARSGLRTSGVRRGARGRSVPRREAPR
jgi:hypothetical protein